MPTLLVQSESEGQAPAFLPFLLLDLDHYVSIEGVPKGSFLNHGQLIYDGVQA
jgi:hypothetical protein